MSLALIYSGLRAAFFVPGLIFDFIANPGLQNTNKFEVIPESIPEPV